MPQQNLYKNQKRLLISKKPIAGKDLFIRQSMDSINQALYSLRSAAGFKLYMYLSKNNLKEGEWWHLSSKDFCEKAGCGISSYNTAVAELLHLGYLRAVYGTQQDYVFNDFLTLTKEQLDAKIDSFVPPGSRAKKS